MRGADRCGGQAGLQAVGTADLLAARVAGVPVQVGGAGQPGLPRRPRHLRQRLHHAPLPHGQRPAPAAVHHRAVERCGAGEEDCGLVEEAARRGAVGRCLQGQRAPEGDDQHRLHRRELPPRLRGRADLCLRDDHRLRPRGDGGGRAAAEPAHGWQLRARRHDRQSPRSGWRARGQGQADLQVGSPLLEGYAG